MAHYKYSIKYNQLNTEKAVMKEVTDKIHEVIRKQKTKQLKSSFIDNYVHCRWIKLSY